MCAVFELECLDCELTDEDLAFIGETFEIVDLNKDVRSRRVRIYIMFFNGACFCNIEADPTFPGAFRALLDFVRRRSGSVNYYPTDVDWNDGDPVYALSPAGIVEQFPPHMGGPGKVTVLGTEHRL